MSEDEMDADIDLGRGRSRFGSFLVGLFTGVLVMGAIGIAVSLRAPPPADLPMSGRVEIVGQEPAETAAETAAEPAAEPAGQSDPSPEPTPEPTPEAPSPAIVPGSTEAEPDPSPGTDAEAAAEDADAPVDLEVNEGAEPGAAAVPDPDAADPDAAVPFGTGPAGGAQSGFAEAPPPADAQPAEPEQIVVLTAPGADSQPAADAQPDPDAPDASAQPAAVASAPQPGAVGAALSANATPFDAPRQVPLMAVVLVGDAVAELSAERLELLTMPLTIAVPPDGPSAARLGSDARLSGHEVLADLPLSAVTGVGDPGPAAAERVAALDMAVGATASDGLDDADVLGPVLAELDRHGLAWVDAGAGIGTSAERIARDIGMPYTQGSKTVSGDADPEQIYRAIDSAARQARQWGTSVLFLDVSEPALQALVRWGLEQRDANPVWFAPISAVIAKRAAL